MLERIEPTARRMGPVLVHPAGVIWAITYTSSVPRCHFAPDGISDRCRVSAQPLNAEQPVKSKKTL